MAVADRLRAVQIKANLIADAKIGLMEIEVDVQDGVATLTGDVTSDAEKETAERLAYEIDGIHEVVNELRVLPISCEEMLTCDLTDSQLGYGPIERDAGDTAFNLSGRFAPPGPGVPTSEQFPGQFSDTDVEEEVRDRLAGQDDVDTSRIAFDSVNQVVYLKGAVKTGTDLNKLRDLVMNARGVMGVRTDDVQVEQNGTGTPVE